MQDFIFIFFAISFVIAMIYFIYQIMLGSENTKAKEELQISSSDLLEQVRILYKQKKYTIAENLAKKYLESKYADDELRLLLIRCLHASGKTYEAIEEAKLIIKHQPNNHSTKVFLANCYLSVMQPTKAITTLKEILQDDPNDPIAIKELAKIYVETNQKRSAIDMYEKLDEFIYSNKEKAKNKMFLAEMYIGFEEYETAIEKYNEILEIYPADVEATKKLITMYKKINEYGMALEKVAELLEMHASDEDDLWALHTLSDAHWKMKDYEKALEYANLVKDHPLSNKTKAADCIARILMESGQVDESINVLKALLPDNPNDIDIRKSLAQSYEAKQDFESAIDIYKKILDAVGVSEVGQVHYEMSNLLSNWAMYLYEQQNNIDCFKKFTLAIQYYKDNPVIYYRLGMINQSIKNFNEAISQYKKAIELDSENALYYYLLAECYAEIDNIFEEKKALVECCKYNPTNAKAFYKLAVLYNLQNDTKNAMMAIKKAIALDDNYIDAKYKLAIMLEHQGDKAEAIELYEQILRLDPENEEVHNNLKMLSV